jgi:putative hydrolase of HD superfamily
MISTSPKLELRKRECNSILHFSRKMERLKRVERKGWIRAGVKRPESVADHSYACVMLSMIASDLCGLDTEHLVRMALLHDLPESVTGDLMPQQKEKLGHKVVVLEKRAAIGIMASLPSRISRKYLSLMDEYWKQRSEESRLLRDIDRIEMSLQALAYVKNGHSAKSMAEFLKSAEKDLRTNVGRSLFEALRSGKRIQET